MSNVFKISDDFSAALAVPKHLKKKLNTTSDGSAPSGQFTFAAPEKPDKEKIKDLEEAEKVLEEECDRLRKQVTDLEEKRAAFQKTIFKQITAANANTYKVRCDKMAETIKTHEEAIEEHEKTIEDLKAKVAKFEIDLDSKDQDYVYIQDQWKAKEEELKAEKEKARAAKTDFDIALADKIEYEKTIKDLETRIEKANTKTEEHTSTIADLTARLATTRDQVEAEKKKIRREREHAEGITTDNRGVLKQLDEQNEKLASITKERDDLKAKEATRGQIEDDLQEARDKLAALEDQIAKLTIDVERKPFDVKPTAYATPNPVAGEPEVVKPSLEDELAGVGGSSNDASQGSSERAHSEEGSDDEESRRSPSPDPTGEDDTVMMGVSGPYTEPPVQVTSVIRTETVFVPFEVSAHNPLLCWIQTELNFLILFSVWITAFYIRVSRFLQRRFVFLFPRRSVPPPADDFDVPAPDNLDVPGDYQTPVAVGTIQYEREKRINEASQAILPLQQEPDNREVFGDPVNPIDDTVPTMPSMFGQSTSGPATAGLSSAASPSRADIDLGTFLGAALGKDKFRPWYQKIVFPLPSDIPSVKKTLLGLLFHLLIYTCISWGIAAHYERKLWLDANDHSRIFLLQLLHSPHGYQSIIYRVASPFLSESLRHSFDVFIFKYFVEKLGLQSAYALPG